MLALLLLTRVGFAQQPRVLTADDYARAERFLGYNTTPLVFGVGVRPTWLADGRFWYRIAIPQGFEYVLVDPAKRTRGRLFDHAALAAALSRAADTTF
ncbi:MAG: S9 family peptidase, partial [Gemmatimonadetes bacterium]